MLCKQLVCISSTFSSFIYVIGVCTLARSFLFARLSLAMFLLDYFFYWNDMSERTFATDCVYTYECEKENKTKQNETIDRQSTRYFSFEISFVFFFRLQFVRFDLFAFALARWLLSRWWMPNVFGPCVFKCKRETYHHHLHIIPFDIWLKIVYVHEKCDQRNERK